ncbi:MAG: PDZ domain-containing protein, partial [Campylobacterales bacterium]|nr:PDZ domain-containing protein [Campylobacterales bacterium]
LLVSLLLMGCGGGGESDSSSSATTFPDYEDNKTATSETTTGSSTSSFSISDKQFLSSLFATEYLWYDKIDTDIDPSAFDDPNTMIDALRYKELDRWSYAETYEEYENFANQTSSGSFGFRYNSETFQVISVVLGSPAQSAGLQRGDTITQINDENISYERLLEAKNNLNVEATFTIQRATQTLKIKIAPAIYTYQVTQYKILTTQSGKKVGWMRYDQFSSSSIAEYEAAFNAFKEQNIDELIIDLRYNGGGYLTTASILMDKIAGYDNDSMIQFVLKHNANLSYKNSSYSFEKDANSLSTISRVFFLTTDDSASASEVVINSLKPYIDVYTIGSTTHGKPVGMNGRSYGEYIYWLINFEIVNANGEGNFYSGIAPTCKAEDNLSFLLDDMNGNMLKEALYYIENGDCLEGN